jgi:hypothetical protein
MVNKKALGRTHNLSVHRDHFRPFGTVVIETNGIEGFVPFFGNPIEIIEPVEMLLVHNRAFALSEADFTVGLAITDSEY